MDFTTQGWRYARPAPINVRPARRARQTASLARERTEIRQQLPPVRATRDTSIMDQ